MLSSDSKNQSHPKSTQFLPEMLHQIFHWLPPEDLKNVLLVCRLWRELGEAPGLWGGMVLKVTRKNLPFMPQVLKSRRMKTVKKMVVETVSEELLEAVIRHKGLRELGAADTDLSRIEPSLLSRAVTGLEEVDISSWKILLTGQQLEAVMNAICERNSRLTLWLSKSSWFHIFGCKEDIQCRLKKLDISGNNLSTLEPGLLAEAAIFLQELALVDTGMTTEQLDALFTVLSTGKSQMKKLCIHHNNMSTVPPGLLARAVNTLEEVGISNTEVTVKQLEAILIDVCNGQSSLKEVDIAGNNLTTLDPSLLAGATKRLEYLIIEETQLTVEQVEAICEAVCEGDSPAWTLDIGLENLSRVNLDLFARTVVKLEYMDLDYTRLTKQQKDAIFAEIIKEDSWLKKMNLCNKDLIRLSPCLIDSAVSVYMLRKVTDEWWRKRLTQLELLVVFLELIVLLLFCDTEKTLKIVLSFLYT